MAIKGLTLKVNDVSQTINLEEILGVSFVGEKALRLAIAQAVVDHIVKRTQDGKNVYGGDLKGPYSDEYQESTVYKLLKDSDDVNMTLTGSMLDDISIIKDSPTSLIIGFKDKKEKAKAFNHNTGDTKGMPKREFFGITQAQVKQIVKENFETEVRELKTGFKGRKTVAEIIRQATALASPQGSTIGQILDFSTVVDLLE